MNKYFLKICENSFFNFSANHNINQLKRVSWHLYGTEMTYFIKGYR